MSYIILDYYYYKGLILPLSLTMTELITWPDDNGYSCIASTIVLVIRHSIRKL